MTKITDKPNLYDLLYKDVNEDIKMYIKILKNYKNILEFGCGTGRVTIPLANDNHFVEAVDISESMLNGLKEKINKDINLKDKIKPVLGDMCDYKGSNLYDAIIIPLTSFNYLMTEKEQIDCLKTVENNLKKGGIALIELLSEKTFLEVNSSDDYVYISDIKINENQYYKYYRKTKLNLEKRDIRQDRLFEYYENGQMMKKEYIIWENRFVTIDDFKKLLLNTNLNIDLIYGNCKMELYNENSEDVFLKLKRL